MIMPQSLLLHLPHPPPTHTHAQKTLGTYIVKGALKRKLLRNSKTLEGRVSVLCILLRRK